MDYTFNDADVALISQALVIAFGETSDRKFLTVEKRLSIQGSTTPERASYLAWAQQLNSEDQGVYSYDRKGSN